MSNTSPSVSPGNVDSNKPTVIVVIGMAGSGKTTMMKALHAHFSRPAVVGPPPTRPVFPKPIKKYDRDEQIVSKEESDNEIHMSDDNQTVLEQDTPLSDETVHMTDIEKSSHEPEPSSAETVKRDKLKIYIINLDPAVQSIPYPINIDIRDTVNYKQVMKQYKLGPNGAIMTSLNLFATKFDQVLELLEKRASQTDVILIDTPGQIEAFNWSASGSIILDSLAVSFPTVVLYVVDTARCKSPVTFMSNMIYACSVLYKSKLPFIMAFNKVDVRSAEECFRWMQSYDAYADDIVNEESYMASLSRSCALAMNEFYEGIRSIGVSAANQLGFVQLEAFINESRVEYFTQYLPWLDEQRAAVQQRRAKIVEESTKRFAEDRKEDLDELRQLEELRARVQKTSISSSSSKSQE